MNTAPDNHRNLLSRLSRYLGRGRLAVAVIVLAAAVGVVWMLKGSGFSLSHTDRIAVTPIQIEKIRGIGQWEFLAVSDEEMIDTVRHGFFGDDELARIYYGTLRLGIDLADTQEDWISMDKDTVTVLLPAIKLLDQHFLDEARTEAFYEEGKWSEADKAAMTRRAIAAMKRRCLTPANIRSAEQNASAQFTTLLQSMGFEWVRVRFRKES